MIHNLSWPEIPQGILIKRKISPPSISIRSRWHVLLRPDNYRTYNNYMFISQLIKFVRTVWKVEFVWMNIRIMITADWDELVHELNWIGKVLTCKALSCNKLYSWLSISTTQNRSPNSSKWSWANHFFKSYTFPWYLPFIHVSN